MSSDNRSSILLYDTDEYGRPVDKKYGGIFVTAEHIPPTPAFAAAWGRLSKKTNRSHPFWASFASGIVDGRTIQEGGDNYLLESHVLIAIDQDTLEPLIGSDGSEIYEFVFARLFYFDNRSKMESFFNLNQSPKSSAFIPEWPCLHFEWGANLEDDHISILGLENIPEGNWIEIATRLMMFNRETIKAHSKPRGRPGRFNSTEHFLNTINAAASCLIASQKIVTQPNLAESLGCDEREIRRWFEKFETDWTTWLKSLNQTTGQN